MKRFACFLVVTLVVALVLIPSSDAITTNGGDVVIGYSPASLTLMSGEWGTVDLDIQNTGEEVLYFEIRANGVETNGGAWCEEEPERFSLAPGESIDAQVRILSRARPFQAADTSDVKISIIYGPNATERPDGTYDVDRPYSRESIEYDVVDEFSPMDGRGPVWTTAMLMILVAVGLSVYMVIRRSKRHGRATDPGGDPGA